LETYDTEGLITIQVAQLEKEKKEISERLRIIAKRIDHTERAYRKDEQPLLAEDYQNQQMTDRETFEAIQLARRELSRQTHQADLETKARLTRLTGDYHARKEMIIAKKGEEFAAKKAVAGKKINEEKEKRLRAVLKAREEERARKEKEEQLRLQKEAEEARLEAGSCFFFPKIIIDIDSSIKNA
jgi:translation initiation factor 3 subunit A